MADIFWPRTDLVTRLLLACVASMSNRAGRGWGRKEENFLPSPPLPPSFIFLLSFHFSRGQKRKSHSSVFLYSETKRKRLLRRLDFSHTPILPISLRIQVTEICSSGMKNSSRLSCRQALNSRQHLHFLNFLDLWWGLLYSAQIFGRLKGNSQRQDNWNGGAENRQWYRYRHVFFLSNKTWGTFWTLNFMQTDCLMN